MLSAGPRLGWVEAKRDLLTKAILEECLYILQALDVCPKSLRLGDDVCLSSWCQEGFYDAQHVQRTISCIRDCGELSYRSPGWPYFFSLKECYWHTSVASRLRPSGCSNRKCHQGTTLTGRSRIVLVRVCSCCMFFKSCKAQP